MLPLLVALMCPCQGPRGCTGGGLMAVHGMWGALCIQWCAVQPYTFFLGPSRGELNVRLQI